MQRLAPLSQWLAARFNTSELSIDKLEKLDGGAIQENWLIDCSIDGELHEWVLRTDSPSTLSTSLGRAQEFAILGVVHAAGIKVPKPVVLCEDISVIGTPFYLMSRAKGMAQASRITRDPDLPKFGDQLAAALGAQLAALHSIALPIPALNFLTAPTPSPAQRRIDGYRADLDALSEGHPVVEFALNWLEDHQPAQSRVTLCHTDYRTGNYMLDRGDLSAILDWEFTSLSDPDEDIGWFSARCWRFGNPQLDAGGIADLAFFCQGYEAVTGVPVNRSVIPYWQVMAEVRWAIIALQQAHRNNSGQEISLELALTGLMVGEMEHNALNLIRRLNQ